MSRLWAHTGQEKAILLIAGCIFEGENAHLNVGVATSETGI